MQVIYEGKICDLTCIFNTITK